MGDLINFAVIVATLFGGTMAAEKIYDTVRHAALSKAAHGLPPLRGFAKT